MKISLKQSVNASIIIAFIGVLVSFPYQGSFIGGLLFAACSAAVIGGLADSFAVSALFGQPLKIKWPQWMGTNIIARNRQRLINELVDMVQVELLSPEMITKQLRNYNVAQAVSSYAQSAHGKQAIKELTVKLVADLLKVSNPSVVSVSLKRLLKQGMNSTQPTVLAGIIIKWLIREQYDSKIIAVLARQLQQFIAQEQVTKFVQEFIATALRSYENNKKGRQFVNGIAGLNADELTAKVMQTASSTLSAIEKGEHAWIEKMRASLLELVADWENQTEEATLWDERLRKLGMALVNGVMDEERVKVMIQSLIEQLDQSALEEQQSSLTGWLHQQLDQLIDRLGEQHDLFEQLNQYVITSLTSFIERNHGYIGRLVREKLEQFDEQQLIALVQEKAGKDLQYIRLNGTLVGALIGLLLFLIQFALGGVLA